MPKAMKRAAPKLFTYGDYLTWPEDERWEIIDGIPYDMTPSPGRIHQKVSGNLFSTIHSFLEGKTCEVYDAPFDVRLPDRDEADEEVLTVVQPDIVVVCDPKKLDDRGCRGAPDWVIEILSPSTSAKDQREKLQLYERHGVREYWVVHPVDRVITIYRRGAKGFNFPEILDDTAVIPVSIFPDLIIRAEKVFPFQPKIVRESPRKYLAQTGSKS